MMDLEPIKTALTAGDYAGARRARLKLLEFIVDELLSDPNEEPFGLACYDYRQGWRETLDELNAMYIPEEP